MAGPRECTGAVLPWPSRGTLTSNSFSIPSLRIDLFAVRISARPIRVTSVVHFVLNREYGTPVKAAAADDPAGKLAKWRELVVVA